MTVSQKDILDFLVQNKELFRSKYHITKLGIFGSFARNEQNEKSDIDIILDFDDAIEDIFDTKQSVKRLLKKRFNRKIDICTESYILSVFKNSILKDSIYV